MIIGIDAEEVRGRATGTGRYLRCLIRVWAREGRDRLLLYSKGPLPPDPLLGQPGVEARPGGGGSRMGGLRWRETALVAAARADSPDVFFSPAYFCPLRLSLPRVTAVHDVSFFSLPHEFSWLDGLRRRSLVAASVRASRAVLACSAFTRREIRTLWPELAGRVHHVPLGRDDDLAPGPSREAARQELGVSGPLLLSVGSLFRRRHIPELLRAVRALRPRWPGLRLDLVGDNRTHPPLDVLELVNGLGLADNVRLSGFVSEAQLALRYAAADVAVYLSEYEGFGLPALEALARGVPVVASFRPALGEVFAGAALLVDGRDIAGIASAIDTVLREPGLREALRSRGDRLAAALTWESTARETRRILEEVARR
jgi:glycosyltransferase involved in cell wall biosynthesis